MLTPDAGGLCIPAGIWAAQPYLGWSALVVLASDPFDPADYETSF